MPSIRNTMVTKTVAYGYNRKNGVCFSHSTSVSLLLLFSLPKYQRERKLTLDSCIPSIFTCLTQFKITPIRKAVLSTSNSKDCSLRNETICPTNIRWPEKIKLGFNLTSNSQSTHFQGYTVLQMENKLTH